MKAIIISAIAVPSQSDIRYFMDCAFAVACSSAPIARSQHYTLKLSAEIHRVNVRKLGVQISVFCRDVISLLQ